MSRRKNRFRSYGSDSYKKVVVPELQIEKKDRDECISLMRRIFEVQSHTYSEARMISFIKEFISELGDNSIQVAEDVMGNIYVQKGEAKTYPCIVSHTDTVHRIIPDSDYVVLNSDTKFFAINRDTMERAGVGGDDKCGIYCCLDNLMRHDAIKIAFFTAEEHGCIGSSNADLTFFDDCSFILQADRKGYADVASDILGTEMFDSDFFTKISETLIAYGRDLVSGGMTDVLELANSGVGVAMANFSCGYYEPHTDDEYVVIDELILTSMLFVDIIKDAYVNGFKNEMIRDLKDLDWPDQFNHYDLDSSGTEFESYYDDNGNKQWRRVGDDKKGGHSSKHIHDRNVCSTCGCVTSYDEAMDMNFCNYCLDYDYNNNSRRL